MHMLSLFSFDISRWTCEGTELVNFTCSSDSYIKIINRLAIVGHFSWFLNMKNHGSFVGVRPLTQGRASITIAISCLLHLSERTRSSLTGASCPPSPTPSPPFSSFFKKHRTLATRELPRMLMSTFSHAFEPESSGQLLVRGSATA